MGFAQPAQKVKINQEQAENLPEFWAKPADQLFLALGVSKSGISMDNAEIRRERYGPNAVVAKKSASVLESFILQFKNPIILLLLVSAIISAVVGDTLDAIIIIAIVFISSVLDLFQEFRATNALQKLMSLIESTVPGVT